MNSLDIDANQAAVCYRSPASGGCLCTSDTFYGTLFSCSLQIKVNYNSSGARHYNSAGQRRVWPVWRL